MRYRDPSPLLQEIIESRNQLPVKDLKFALEAIGVVCSIFENVDGKEEAGYGATKKQITALNNIYAKAAFILSTRTGEKVKINEVSGKTVSAATASDILGTTTPHVEIDPTVTVAKQIHTEIVTSLAKANKEGNLFYLGDYNFLPVTDYRLSHMFSSCLYDAYDHTVLSDVFGRYPNNRLFFRG